jgi:TatD-related deoxyribonuclease
MIPSVPQPFPILDNHMHLDPLGLNLEAIKRFAHAGGTHVIISHKPYEDIPVHRPEDYRTAFDRTVKLVEDVNKNTGVKAFATVGPYPVEFLEIEERDGFETAKATLLKGMDIAKEYVLEKKAVGIGEIGRPHFQVDPKVLEAANEIMVYGMNCAHEAGCCVVLHTESPGNDAHLKEILELSKTSGISPHKIVKHFSPPRFADPNLNYGITPSVIARGGSIRKARSFSNRFLMETDYIDSLERPDVVLPPETVPNVTNGLLAEGRLDIEDVHFIHKELPESIYDIAIDL